MKGLGIGHQSGASPYESLLSTSQEFVSNVSQQAMKSIEDSFKEKNTKKIKNSNTENIN